MSERKYVVPAGGLQTALDAANEFSPIRPPLPDLDGRREAFARVMLEAFIRWQSKHPIVPSLQEMSDWVESTPETDCGHFAVIAQLAAVEWQRRMWLEPEPELELPEAIKDLLWVHSNNGSHLDANRDILEAYRRGREAGAK